MQHPRDDALVNFFSDDDHQPTEAQTRRGGGRRGQQGQQQNSRRDDRGGSSAALSKQDSILILKSSLALHQRVRLLESATLVTQTHESAHAVPNAVKDAGTVYHNMTIGKSGHKFGPPAPYLILRAAVAAHGAATSELQKTAFRNFVEGFCTPTVFTETSQLALQHFETEKEKGYTMAQVLARLTEKAEQETRTRLAVEIQVFRFKICKGNPQYTNFQFATRSQNPQITTFLSSLLDLLTSQADGEMRYGTAPPSATERALRAILDRLGGGGRKE